MEGDRGEFNDWELLHNSDHSSDSTAKDSKTFDGIDGDSEGIIRSDYFSLDNQGRLAVETVEASEDDSVDSDNPSWIDPAVPEARYGRINQGEFWSDSASDRSDDRKSTDFDPKKELSFLESAKSEAEIDHASREAATAVESGGGEDAVKVICGDLIAEAEAEAENASGDVVVDPVVKEDGEREKRVVAWWKVPLELLKLCAFKVSPVWTFSVAAAVLGMLMLGRRLYRMKRKTRTLQLKVTMDDKKVSQFMSRAARLNEVFSVVKRVPIVRPALPAPGNISPWPVMSLR